MQIVRRARLIVLLLALLSAWPLLPARAAIALPPIVFVARSHLATPDYIFRKEVGPPGQLTTGIDSFAPGSKLLLRDADGTLRVLVDTAQPAGSLLNPLGLKDLAGPDVSFDATRIVFAGTFGPEAQSSVARPRFSWRLFEYRASGNVRQLTFSDRKATIPDGLGNAQSYGFYDDLFPAYLADGRIVFSSSRYPSLSHYDGRPTFNLYVIQADGSDLQRITTERGSALHPTPLPDGRILWSRWWVNFNQPSETGVYQRIDNDPGTEPARDQAGQIVTTERRVTVRVPGSTGQAAAQAAVPIPTPWQPTFVERLDPATGRIYRVQVTPAPRPPAAPRATPMPAPAPQGSITREVTVRVPVTGHRLPDGTLVYSNTNTTFLPARGRLADGSPIRDAPNTWHLMAIDVDGSNMQRFAWTPRYRYELTSDDGQDTFNAAQPGLVFANGEMLVAYTTQRDGTMAHTSARTGIRVARPGIAHMAENTTESIAGMRWEGGDSSQNGYALHPVGLPDGRILFSQSVPDPQAPTSGSYAYTRNGGTANLSLQGGQLRYSLRIISADGSGVTPVPLLIDYPGFDFLDAKPVVVRQVGNQLGQWQRPVAPLCNIACPAAALDDPLAWNVPRGLLTGDGLAAYAWSLHQIADVKLTVLHNANVYANPPLELPFVNNSPPPGSVAFADIYIDAPQFSGASYRSLRPDEQVRAVKWLTVPVNPDGSFTASAPADTPTFIVLRDRQGRVVRGVDRSPLAIAQGNAPGRAGQVVQCVGCHIGHTNSLDGLPLARLGWTNVAPAARTSVSSGTMPDRLNDRRGYVPAGPNAADRYQDRTPPWMAAGSRGEGEWAQLDWSLPIAMLNVRLVGPEAGQEGLSSDYAIAGELRFLLNDVEVPGSRQTVTAVAPLSQGGTTIELARPIAANRVVFFVTDVRGTRYGSPAPAALSEIEVIGQGATPQVLANRPVEIRLPDIGR